MDAPAPVPYEQRKTLLQRGAQADATIDWASMIAVAEQRAEADAQAMIIGGARLPRPGEQALTGVKQIWDEFGFMTWLGSMFWAFISMVVIAKTNWSVPADIAFALIPILIGGGSFAVAARAEILRRRCRSIPEALEVLVPSSVSYIASGLIYGEGEVIAEITRFHPIASEDQGLSFTSSAIEKIGSVSLGADEDTAEIAERFAELSDELQKITETADRARGSALAAVGLAGEDLTTRELALRERVSKSRERLQLNAALPQALKTVTGTQ